MEKIKLLLYATKSKPYLVYGYINKFTMEKAFDITYSEQVKTNLDCYNGKIVAECDFEAEHLYNAYNPYRENVIHYFDTDTLNEAELIKRSCLSNLELENYFKDKNGYAIHIKNLHIFDYPMELNEIFGIKKEGKWYITPYYIKRPPQNMMRCYYEEDGTDIIHNYILISIHPEWLCKILNGEKTIEVRKKVLKEMLY